MPYNTTAIPPRKEATGQTQLPLSRVKKIIAADPDINMCSNNAAFVITLATEMFVQHLATEAQNMARTERKPRRNIQYKDVANAVAASDALEFLEDVVPRTQSFKDVRDRAASTRAKLVSESSGAAANGGGAKGDGAGNTAKGPGRKSNGFTPRIVSGADRTDRTSPEPSDQLRSEFAASVQNRGPGRPRKNRDSAGGPGAGKRKSAGTGNAGTSAENGHRSRDQDGDIEMGH